mmetsp:Transcript_4956/g.16572  ORF Transcript_4956/g.16572 Transcript_4956/m.16572 type:complete len:398 (+) Transcript_4956:203-1396(+)
MLAVLETVPAGLPVEALGRGGALVARVRALARLCVRRRRGRVHERLLQLAVPNGGPAALAARLPALPQEAGHEGPLEVHEGLLHQQEGEVAEHQRTQAHGQVVHDEVHAGEGAVVHHGGEEDDDEHQVPQVCPVGELPQHLPHLGGEQLPDDAAPAREHAVRHAPQGRGEQGPAQSVEEVLGRLRPIAVGHVEQPSGGEVGPREGVEHGEGRGAEEVEGHRRGSPGLGGRAPGARGGPRLPLGAPSRLQVPPDALQDAHRVRAAPAEGVAVDVLAVRAVDGGDVRPARVGDGPGHDRAARHRRAEEADHGARRAREPGDHHRRDRKELHVVGEVPGPAHAPAGALALPAHHVVHVEQVGPPLAGAHLRVPKGARRLALRIPLPQRAGPGVGQEVHVG